MKKETTLFNALIPILGLFTLLIYGLIIHPRIFHTQSLPLEMIFLFAAVIGSTNLFRMGFTWEEIQLSMVKKIKQGLPAMMILFSIGIVIAAWIVSGTIPMMIYYGIKIINPQYLYVIAFVVPIIFSTLTGTSWGSVGTIGVVIMGIAQITGAHLPIIAGAIVGGAYFGDKLSPLSDTTNIAALAAGVPLFDHIRSMLNTTIPAAILALLVYAIIGLLYPINPTSVNLSVIETTLTSLQSIFHFNLLLLAPILIVLVGSLKKMPTVPTLLVSSLLSMILAMVFQRFTLTDVVFTLHGGFNITMATWVSDSPSNVIEILNRGGLYSMATPVIITLIVFAYIGTLDCINALPFLVHRGLRFAKTRRAAILSALAATAITNAMTSNQFVTSFVVAEAFKPKFKVLKIPRKVLSRSLEDAGTMIENMLPWSTTGVFMSATLGVAVMDYNRWQFLTMFNIIVAIVLAITGIGCFYHEKQPDVSSEEE